MIEIFQQYIESGQDFTFTKFGDGEIICMLNRYTDGDTNCDKQSYSRELSDGLWEASKFFSRKHQVHIGKWEDIFALEFDNELRRRRIELNYVPYATLLHIDSNDLNKVKSFYQAVSKRKDKVYICPEKLNKAQSFLDCDIINVKENEAFSDYQSIKQQLLSSDYKIFMYSAGLMSKVLIADVLKEKCNTTHLDIGSGLDNVFGGITRSFQVEKEKIKELYD